MCIISLFADKKSEAPGISWYMCMLLVWNSPAQISGVSLRFDGTATPKES